MTTSPDELWSAIADGREAVLGTVDADGMPHMTNVYYVVDETTAGGRIIRVSTTSARAQGRNALGQPHAALYVAGGDFFNFTVAQGEVSAAEARTAGDDATDELYEVHRRLKPRLPDRPEFDHRMIADRRMVLRINVSRVYGLRHP